MNDTAPEPGSVVEIEPGIRRILAPNPSPMTHWGTNTYILGTGSDLCVVDPGPAIPAHLDAILGAISGARVTRIVVTHSHRDHSPLARDLARRTGAEIAGFGPSDAGRSAMMQALARSGLAGGGEGVDREFLPDLQVEDGSVLSGADWSVEVIHTPGHMGNHVCLAMGDTILTGDHVMGWASSLVSPPDGDVSDFVSSCARLALRQARLLLPGHGRPIDDPLARLDWLITHRREREAQILERVGPAPEPATAGDLARTIYTDIPDQMLPAAERNVFAHLVDLTAKGVLATPGPISPDSAFHRL